MSKGRHKFFVGIDYGTTYSGVAYALPTASDGKDVQIITDWPGNTGRNNDFLEKVPSSIVYQAENGDKNLRGDLWGYEVKPTHVNCSWTKLLLDRHVRPTEYDDKNLGATVEDGLFRLPAGKTAADVVTDYLSKLYEHCMKILSRHYAEFLTVTPIEFWLTVPAMWSPNAENTTRESAKKAGFGSRPNDSIKIISEPEAGVIAAINSEIEGIQGAFKPGTGFLVCDCGGGTVDLISYAVESTEPILKLRETCPGNGGKCGATSVDRNFHASMRRWFGEAFSKLPTSDTGPGSRFMRDFEGYKKDFEGYNKDYAEGSGELNRIHLKMSRLTPGALGASRYDFETDEVLFSNHDMQECFDPVIDQILALVEQQVKDTADNSYPEIKIIVLIGGFGSSLYLWDKLTAWGRDHGDIQCIVPTRPWSAIARGAALRGLQGSRVPFKKCRLHYGATIDCPYDEKRDSPFDKTWTHPRTGEKMVSHCMDWWFKRNDEISHDTKKEIEFTHYHYPHKAKNGTLNFYSCKLSRAPLKKTSMVDHVGSISFNIADVDLSECENGPTDQRSKKRVYWIVFTVIVRLGSEEGTLDIAVMWKDKVCGSNTFKFAHDDV